MYTYQIREILVKIDELYAAINPHSAVLYSVKFYEDEKLSPLEVLAKLRAEFQYALALKEQQP
ncbi:MAG: hypothetical protein AAB649_07650 [Patescibacteria group bacterium]